MEEPKKLMKKLENEENRDIPDTHLSHKNEKKMSEEIKRSKIYTKTGDSGTSSVWAVPSYYLLFLFLNLIDLLSFIMEKEDKKQILFLKR